MAHERTGRGVMRVDKLILLRLLEETHLRKSFQTVTRRNMEICVF